MTSVAFDLSVDTPPDTQVDLGHGVVAVLRPWTGLLQASADVIRAAEMDAFRRGFPAEGWGIERRDGDLDDAELFAGAWALIDAAIRASLRIVSWNVVQPDGEPLEATRYVLARLFHRGVGGTGGPDHLAAFLQSEI